MTRECLKDDKTSPETSGNIGERLEVMFPTQKDSTSLRDAIATVKARSRRSNRNQSITVTLVQRRRDMAVQDRGG